MKIDGGAVTFDNAEAIGGYGEDEMRLCSVCVYDGSFTVKSGIFTGEIGVMSKTATAHPKLKITKATLYDGIEHLHSYDDTGDYDFAGLKAFFADGSVMFDENGKYIDITDEKYWYKEEGKSFALFSFTNECSVKPHTHTYSEGVCSECDYICQHYSGKNERDASYFEKAICSVCHAEYGDYAKDTTAPTGEIKIKERTWWQSLLNTISFGIFYKEEVTVEITADDDSYTQSGYDAARHAVKIEYLISNTAMSEETVKASTFTEYSGAIDLSDEDQYVIYAKLIDHAGNIAYAGSDGFEIDKTAPLIDGMKNGGVYFFCGEKTITIIDTNIDKATIDSKEITLDENGQFTVPADSEKHKIVVADKAGNETTVCITVYPSHNFDPETDTCKNCGTPAVAKVEKGDISDLFATGDELFKALADEKYDSATVTLLKDAEYMPRSNKAVF